MGVCGTISGDREGVGRDSRNPESDPWGGGKRLIQGMQDGTLETVRSMQVSIQMLAPRALERLGKQLDSSNEMVSGRGGGMDHGSCGSLRHLGVGDPASAWAEDWMG